MDPQAAQLSSSSSGVKKALLFLIIVLVVLVLAGVAFLVFKGEPVKKEPQVLTGLEKDSVTIGSYLLVGVFPDSGSDFDSTVFNNNIFEGLGKISNGQVKPALATSWSNPDKNTWRFNLRKEVKFHNGDTLTAGDVKFSIETAIKEKWPYSFNLDTVKSVTVVDDYTIEVKTSSPDPVLLNRLVFAFVVSEKQFKNRGNAPAVGTGPYKFVSLDKEKGVLEANDNYYLGAPKVKKVTYKFFSDDVTDKNKLEALNKGEVDLVSIGDKQVADSAKGKYQIKSLSAPFISFIWLDTKRDKSPYVDKTPNPLKNKLVRQAIYKALDAGELIKETNLSAVPASQFVTEAIFGFNPNIKRQSANTTEAKSLLSQSGYKDGFNLTIDTIKGQESELEAIAKQLGEIGIKVKVNGVSGDTIEDKLTKRKDTSAFLSSYGAETYDAGEIFSSLLHSPTGSYGANNYLGYSNKEIDKLAEEIDTAFDQKTRQEKLQEAMSKAMEELPLVPLYNAESFYLMTNYIDWTPTAFGAIYGSEISGRQISSQ